MAEPLSWIRLNRNITTWRHWQNHRVAIIFLWLLTKAQYGEESYVESTKINRGEVVTSIDRISEENGISYQQVRDVLKILKKTGEISTRRGQRFVIIKIENYEKYQPLEVYDEQSETKQKPNREQTANKQRTNRKQSKNNTIRNIESIEGKEGKKRIPPKSPKGDSSSYEEGDGEWFDTQTGRVKRGTDAFRNQSHLILKPEEGTADDIPVRYREMCNNDFAIYVRYRNT